MKTERELQRIYARMTGPRDRRPWLSEDDKGELVGWLEKKGRLARQSGNSVKDCPYGMSELIGRTAWLAGYHDKARGLQ